MKTKKVIFEVYIRTEDIDKNKIDVEKDIEDITKSIAEYWNVESITVK